MWGVTLFRRRAAAAVATDACGGWVSRAAHRWAAAGELHELPPAAPVPAAGLLALNTLGDNPGAMKQVRPTWRLGTRAQACERAGMRARARLPLSPPVLCL